MMVQHKYAVNSFTFSMILQACTFKGRGLSDVALAMYRQSLASSGEDVPVILRDQLLQVSIAAPCALQTHGYCFRSAGSVHAIRASDRKRCVASMQCTNAGCQLVVVASR